ncbi:hypothetical protein SAMN05444365_11466 [Micromonospora pattaloongensis]|uniref:Uncharacterized protein n=1 Tax=Micromonospora pattaloongensis TaxID=405436 RepID=A0A1H3SVR9_9ACTN|nr:hypothetical protein [Micromonospora pattaloongensis]SDZ41748.1 hypothetical protein SAMN05444365_11466 [Micromonospora pattaloongensis]
MSELHVPDRPSWQCARGDGPWPCDAAKAELRAAYDPVGLAMHGAERLAEAAAELPNATPRELFTRFVAWTKRP